MFFLKSEELQMFLITKQVELLIVLEVPETGGHHKHYAELMQGMKQESREGFGVVPDGVRSL